MLKIKLLAGPPGSGKTTWLNEQKATDRNLCVIDDYHACSFDSCEEFVKGRCYERLIYGLKKGEKWICADIEWCDPMRRDKVVQSLRTVFEDIEIQWLGMRTGLDECKKRIQLRGRENVDEELEKAEQHHKSLHDTPPPNIQWVG